MFERPSVGQEAGQEAVIVHIAFGSAEYTEADREFRELVKSSGAQVVEHIGGTRKVPDPRYFVGGGKVDEIAQQLTACEAKLVVFNHDLSPSQERNLEKRLGARVLDRTGLILDIFARRAQTHEGQLQVELAQLEHLATRLVRGWSHLERQKGGIGLRGPGETQLETDRRLLGHRIKTLKARLEKVRRRREQGRAARKRSKAPVVSLVGYTNAGKTTLFNQLTGANVLAADQLFATLDPTLRRLPVPVGEDLIIADTVGFIRDLPHNLVAAFRATLEETRNADVLLHVSDAADPERYAHARQVEAVLEQINAERIPRIEIYNKIDQLEDSSPRVDYAADGQPKRVWLSAGTGEGVDTLRAVLADFCYPDMQQMLLSLPPEKGWLRAQLYELGEVQHEAYTAEGNCQLQVIISKQDLQQLLQVSKLTMADVCLKQQAIQVSHL